MSNLTRAGKINIILGIIFCLLGAYLFYEQFNNVFVLQEQYLSISFICIGTSFILASSMMKKQV
ncbi:uncharacterized membrane protein HdeD (DUF308 family) [Cytobacillus horneckiae]|uniref:hypothetical protein n=1 Tax=Cytobacillus horneckiae TaxID=549687 RepID=UPI000AE85404|nr:hypothetical protein [Cytobacillus horneckiae]MBN6886460.1 hypothetical protein [Cytobacillus horneckiae]